MQPLDYVKRNFVFGTISISFDHANQNKMLLLEVCFALTRDISRLSQLFPVAKTSLAASDTTKAISDIQTLVLDSATNNNIKNLQAKPALKFYCDQRVYSRICDCVCNLNVYSDQKSVKLKVWSIYDSKVVENGQVAELVPSYILKYSQNRDWFIANR